MPIILKVVFCKIGDQDIKKSVTLTEFREEVLNKLLRKCICILNVAPTLIKSKPDKHIRRRTVPNQIFYETKTSKMSE